MMKKRFIAVLVSGFSAIIFTNFSFNATAQSADSVAITRPSPPATTRQAKAARQRVVYRKSAARRKTAAASSLIPHGAVKWSCEGNKILYVNGDLKRDKVLTVHWARRNYKLPRQTTTTGADRFHDPASGLDLVVIPSKAMLLNDKNASRLADECKTQAMAQASLPTASNLNQPGLLNQEAR